MVRVVAIVTVVLVVAVVAVAAVVAVVVVVGLSLGASVPAVTVVAMAAVVVARRLFAFSKTSTARLAGVAADNLVVTLARARVV